MNYLSRHWRGELSLPVAFWVNNGLLLLPLGIALGLLMVWAQIWGESLQAYAAASLVALVLLVAVSVWAPVGAWRSARRYREEGGSPAWAFLAQALLALGLLGNLASFVADVLPALPEQLRMARGRDPIGELEIELAADGRSVSLRGPFGMGAATRFEQTLKDAPSVRRVLLDSPGGRLYEAHEIATRVRERGLHTRAVGDCASACTLVFVAGAQRSVARSARLGFHRARTSSMNPLHDELANRKLAELYGQAGLPSDFVGDVLRTPAASMWFPRVDVLVSAGILPLPSLRPELDPAWPADAPLARYRDALTDNPLWVELDRRQPGLVDAAADRIQQARRRGAPVDAAALEADAVAMGAVPTVLRTAGARAQEAYLAMLAAELRARSAGGDAACLPSAAPAGPAMPERVHGWLQGALVDAADLQPARPLSAIELEVLRRELGPVAPERIAALAAVPGTARKAGAGCAKTIELLDAMARLRGPQRRLAVRWMLQPG